MRYPNIICAVALSSFAASPALADVTNPNPHAVISIVGADRVSLREPAQRLEQGFAIKLVDPQGQTMAGLKVDFVVDRPVEVLPPPGAPPLPPAATYGP